MIVNKLIIKNDAIGDFFVFYPYLVKMINSEPNTNWYILLRKNLLDLTTEIEGIKGIFSYSKNSFEKDREYGLNLIQSLKNKEFETVYVPIFSRNLHADFLAHHIGAKNTISFMGNSENMNPDLWALFNGEYSNLVSISNSIQKESNRYEEWLIQLGIKNDSKDDTPLIALAKSSRNKVNELLAQRKLKKFVTLAPFAQFSIRHWPESKWISILQENWNQPLIVVGENVHRATVQNWLNKVNNSNVHNFCGYTDIRDLCEILKRSIFHIGVESASAHIASHFKRKSLTLVGGGHAGRFLPYSSDQVILRKSQSCDGCNWLCSYNESFCMTEIPVEEVKQVLKSEGLIKYFNKKITKVFNREEYFLGSMYRHLGDEKNSKKYFQRVLQTSGQLDLLKGAFGHLSKLDIENKIKYQKKRTEIESKEKYLNSSEGRVENFLKRLESKSHYDIKKRKLYFILCTGRCGSDLLVDYLNSCINSHCYGELLHRSYFRYGWGLNLLNDFQYRFDSLNKVKKYIELCWNIRPEYFLGLKIRRTQWYDYKLTIKKLLEFFPQSQFIVLYRRSLLDQFLSWERTKLTKTTALKNEKLFKSYLCSETANEKIRVDLLQFNTYQDSIKLFYEDIFGQQKSNTPMILLNYEDLSQNPQKVFNNSIFPFLGMKRQLIKTKLKKLNCKSYSEIIQNFDEVEKNNLLIDSDINLSLRIK